MNLSYRSLLAGLCLCIAFACPEAAAIAATGASPETIVLEQDGKRETMRYMRPTMRTAARALGFGGVATYAVLRGTAAKLRLGDRRPSFIVAVPANAQPEDYLTLASLAVRRNGTREVIVGGGYMSYSTGIHQDRIVATSGERATDQGGAPDGFVFYTVTPDAPLKAGEYAVVTYNSQIPVAGWFAGGFDSYFDFGVD